MNSQKPKFSLKMSLEEREKQLLEMPDAEIDFSDCPEITPEMLAKGTVRPITKSKSSQEQVNLEIPKAELTE